MAEKTKRHRNKKKRDKAILRPRKHSLINRTFLTQGAITLLLILIQIVFIVLAVIYLINEFILIMMLIDFILVLVVIFAILRRPGDISYKIAWITTVAILPVFGSLLYVWVRMFPNTKIIIKRYNKRIEETKEVLPQNVEIVKRMKEDYPTYGGVFAALYEQTAAPVNANQKLTHYKVGEDAYPYMLEALENAKEFVFLEYFIIAGGKMFGEIIEILRRKVKEGVEVRLIYDGLNHLTSVPRNYHRHLRKTGIKVKVFAPLSSSVSPYQNNRDHRKLFIVDGKVAFTGGINLADEYINEIDRFGYWKDTVVKIEGDAVNTMTAQFLQMWSILGKDRKKPMELEKYMRENKVEEEINNYLVPYIDLPDNKMAISEQLFVSQIAQAHKYVHVFTPYLVMSESLRKEIIFAAKRGLEVIIIMPSTPDKRLPFWVARSYYKKLIKEGVQIYEYTPGFMHAKATITDDEFVNTGSVNYDFRSLFLNYENGIIVADKDYAKTVEADFQECLEQSLKISEKEIKEFPWWQKVMGRIGRIFGTLF